MTVAPIAAAILLAIAQTGPDLGEAEAQSLIRMARNLTPDEIDGLEHKLTKNPDDFTARVMLLAHHSFRVRRSGRDAFHRHAMWLITHHPDSPTFRRLHVRYFETLDPKFAEAAAAWKDNVERYPDDANVLGNAAMFFMLERPGWAREYLERAAEIEPDDPEWAEKLGRAYEDMDPLRSLEWYERALSLTEPHERIYMLDDVAMIAVRAGEGEKATRYATELLDAAVEIEPDWNYGNCVHKGHLVLGLVALDAGDHEEAGRQLLRAGDIPGGSPQMNSFGPNMVLAKKMLEAGHREVVIEYLQLCGRFWKKSTVDAWIEIIESGGMPRFRGNLRY